MLNFLDTIIFSLSNFIDTLVKGTKKLSGGIYIPIDLSKIEKEKALELYKLCNKYMNVYEDQMKWENIDFNKIKNNG